MKRPKRSFQVIERIHPIRKTETLHIRLRPQDLERLRRVAKSRGVTMTEVIVDYIKRLPNLPES